MKKRSLLSLLALAGIFLLGCQNYDDQFDALNKEIDDLKEQFEQVTAINTKIEALQKDMDELEENVATDEDVKDIGTNVSNLQSRLEELKGQIEGLKDNPQVKDEDIERINEAIASLQERIEDIQENFNVVDEIKSNLDELRTDINAIKASTNSSTMEITDVVSAVADLQDRLEALSQQVSDLTEQVDEDPEVTEEDIEQINTSIDDLRQEIEEFLARNDFAQGPISITNLAELAFVKTLGEFRNVRGDFTVDIDDPALRDSIEAVNTILKRIIVVTNGDVVLSSHETFALDASSLNLIDGNLTVSENAAKLDALTSVSGDVELEYMKDYDFPLLTRVGNLNLYDGEGVTRVNLPSLRGNNGAQISTEGQGNGELTLNTATEIIIGDIEVNTLTAPLAESISLGFDGQATAETTITAPVATSFTADIEELDDNNYTVAGGPTLAVDLSELKSSESDITISGASANLESLESVEQLTLNTVSVVSLPALATATGIAIPDATSFTANELSMLGSALTTANVVTFNAEKLNVANTLTLAAATTIRLGSVATANLVAANVEHLTLTQLQGDTAIDLSANDELETLDITGVVIDDIAHDAQINHVTVDDASKLKTVTLGGTLGDVNLANNTDLTEINTSGYIRGITINTNEDLETVTLGHTFVRGERANTVIVTDNAKLTSLDMEAVKKAKTITITGNAELTSILVDTGTAAETLVEPETDISFTVTGNNLLGSYLEAVVQAETIDYDAAEIVQEHLYRFKQLILAYQNRTDGANTVTYNLSFDRNGETPPTNSLIELLDADTVAQAGPDGDPDADDDAQTDNGDAGAGTGINTANELEMLLTAHTRNN